MAELLGPDTDEDAVRSELVAEGLVFEDPEAGWQTADAYLSGNVKHKLRVAERAVRAEPRYGANVEALRLVIPAEIAPGQIDVRLGTHWIPAADINAFLVDTLSAEEPRWSHTDNQFVRYVPLSRAEALDPVYLRCEYVYDVDRQRAVNVQLQPSAHLTRNRAGNIAAAASGSSPAYRAVRCFTSSSGAERNGE